MKSSWKLKAVYAGILVLQASVSQAANKWLCEFETYRHDGGTEVSTFRVEGSRLIENSGDVIVEYQLLENSDAAIVAAKGASYSSAPSVMGFLVMIDKKNGRFLLATAPIGETDTSQTGTCRSIKAQRN
jgi:hypothetical protein